MLLNHFAIVRARKTEGYVICAKNHQQATQVLRKAGKRHLERKGRFILVPDNAPEATKTKVRETLKALDHKWCVRDLVQADFLAGDLTRDEAAADLRSIGYRKPQKMLEDWKPQTA